MNFLLNSPLRAAAGEALFFGAVFLAVSLSHDQPCCTATAAGEQGLVGRCYMAGWSVSLDGSRYLGSYDGSGNFTLFNQRDLYDAGVTLAGGTHIGGKRAQIYGALPLRSQWRGYDERTWSIGLGDASIGIRYMLLEDMLGGIHLNNAQSWIPFLDFYLSGRFPTGTGPLQSQDANAADVTGGGDYGTGFGAKITKFLTPSWSFSIRSAYEISGESIDSPNEFRRGDELTTAGMVLWNRTILYSFGTSAVSRHRFNARNRSGEIPESGSARWIFSVFGNRYLSYPAWEMTGSWFFPPWWDGGGSNVSMAAMGFSLQLRRNLTWPMD